MTTTALEQTINDDEKAESNNQEDSHGFERSETFVPCPRNSEVAKVIGNDKIRVPNDDKSYRSGSEDLDY